MQQRIRGCLGDLLDQDMAERARLENRGGHASLRIYWRIELPAGAGAPRGEPTLMAMVLADSADGFESAEVMSDNAPAADELPFVNVHRYLADIGMPVADIDLVDMDRGVLLLEDLGDQTLEAAIEDVRRRDDLSAEAHRSAFLDLYRQSIDLLVSFQKATVESMVDPDFGAPDDCIGFGRSFDRKLFVDELDHYIEWGLEARLDDQANDRLQKVRADIDAEFSALVDALGDIQQVLVLRDYQSRNLMHKASADHGGNGWHLIDFQDALKGPFVYDLVALLRDSYVELDPAQLDTLLDWYVDRGAEAGLPWCADADRVYEAFHLQTIQRKLKDAGRFVYIDRVNGDSSFLAYYDRSIRYVQHALEQVPGFDALAEHLGALEPSWDAK